MFLNYSIKAVISALAVTALAGCSLLISPWSQQELQRWHAEKAALGPAFAGSPAWQAHMDFVEQRFAAAGVIDVSRLPAPYMRWWAADKPTSAQRALVVDDVTVPVASTWAYSGSTESGGVTAPLLLYDKSLPRSALQDRIVVFRVEPVPAQMAMLFSVEPEYATADSAITAGSIVNEQWYQGNYVTRFGRFDEVLRDSGAVGAVVVFPLSAARLDGMYTFPLLNTGIVGVPGLYVDELAGERVTDAALLGVEATLVLQAETAPVEPYFYTAVLPGRSHGTAADEEILLVTHSDGPNLTQENGTLAILALMRHYARVPRAQRARSLRVLLDPQHFSPGRHTIDWYAAHPAIMQRVVASVGVEQLGQLEYIEDAAGYRLSGLPEPWQIFVRDDPQLIAAAIRAVEASGVPRTEVRVPEKKGQGRWNGLGEVALKYDLAGFATLSDMSGYWSTRPGIESFDAQLADRQLSLLVMLIDELMGSE